MSINTLVKSVQDIMRKDTGVDGDAQRISQLVWLIFLKIFDDKEQEWELTYDAYSPLEPRHRWSSWAKNPEGITGEEFNDLRQQRSVPGPQDPGRLAPSRRAAWWAWSSRTPTTT